MTANLNVEGAFSASSTAAISGLVTLDSGFLSSASSTVTGNFSANGTLAVATSSPAEEVGITGDVYVDSAATTTLHVKSTGAANGGCLEIEGVDDVIYRLTINTVTGTGLVVEAGTCQ